MLSDWRSVHHHPWLSLNQTPGEVVKLAPTANQRGGLIDGITFIAPVGMLT